MIRGSLYVRLDLVDPDDHLDQSSADRRALGVLAEAPAGIHALVDIGSRKYLGQNVASMLHEADPRLDIEIIGQDPHAVALLIQAARSGVWWPA